MPTINKKTVNNYEYLTYVSNQPTSHYGVCYMRLDDTSLFGYYRCIATYITQCFMSPFDFDLCYFDPKRKWLKERNILLSSMLIIIG